MTPTALHRPDRITGDQLSAALRALGINFILGGQSDETPLLKHPARLMTALARSDEARLRLALIPLFLQHPEFSAQVCLSARRLPSRARLTLQCYYSAAVWLGQKYDIFLPDYFSTALALPLTPDPEENLRQLAKRHAELSGMQLNWLGTYQHAAQIWVKGLEYQKVSA
jgi:hypothetical protein